MSVILIIGLTLAIATIYFVTCAVSYAIGYGHGWTEVLRRLDTQEVLRPPTWMP